MKTVFYALLAIALVLGLWMAIPAKWLYNPTQVIIEGDQIRVYRTYPAAKFLGAPYIRYSEIIRPADGSTPCADVQEFRYNDNGLAYGQWTIGHWAHRCLALEIDYVYHVAWSPRLFDIVPLRPVEIEALIRLENGSTHTILVP